MPITLGSMDPCFSCTERMQVVDVRSGDVRVYSPGELRRWRAARSDRGGAAMNEDRGRRRSRRVAYLALVLFASPLLEGVMRKVKAIVHSRKGPPVMQPYLDLAKLLVKEDVVSAPGLVARFAPPAAFACVLAAAFFVPVRRRAPAARGWRPLRLHLPGHALPSAA